MTEGVPEDGSAARAAEIVGKHWALRARPVRTDLGVSRITWRVGADYWLSQSEDSRSTELIRQTKLLHELRSFLVKERISFTVPEILPSLSGEMLVWDCGYGWSLTRHMEGFHPDSRNPRMYTAFVDGLARFHKAVASAFAQCPTAAPPRISVETRQHLKRLNNGPFVPFTPHQEEEHTLRRAADWLFPRVVYLEQLPRQLVHGDWTPLNVLFRSDQNGAYQGSLAAVLDFERIGMDPIHVDVANVCSTLLMWSGLDGTSQRIREVLNDYEHFAGIRVDCEHIQVAMLAHWFCHYWNWRDRIAKGEPGAQVKERLVQRIASVLDYFEGIAVR